MSQMKLGIIAEFYDRASKGINKLMRVNSKLEKSAKTQNKLAKAHNSTLNKTARAHQKVARAMNIVRAAASSAFNAMQRGAKAAGRAIMALHRKTILLARTGLGHIRNGTGRVMRGVAIASGIAFAAFGASALAANQLVGTASQFEGFQTILQTTEGTSEKARTAMEWVTNFAANTPYELDQVMESFVRLRTYGLEPTNGFYRRSAIRPRPWENH